MSSRIKTLSVIFSVVILIYAVFSFIKLVSKVGQEVADSASTVGQGDNSKISAVSSETQLKLIGSHSSYVNYLDEKNRSTSKLRQLSGFGKPDKTDSSVDKDETLSVLSSQDVLQRDKIVQLFNAKKYSEALEFAEIIRAKSSLPLRQWIDIQYPVLLTAVGWFKLDAGLFGEAQALFIEALNLREEREAKRGLLLCAYKSGERDNVLKWSEELLQGNKDDPLVKKIRTEVLESEGRIEEARNLYKMGDERQRIIGKKSVLAKSQVQLSSNHFQLTFDQHTEQNKIEAVLQFLEDALIEYQEVGFGLPSRLIEVVFYRKDDFMGVVAGQPIWAEGLFDGRMRIPVSSVWSSPYSDSRLATVLRHELSHALLHEAGKMIPPGMDEGIAQRMACRKSGCSPLSGATDFQPKATFDQSFIGLSSENARLAYKQSLYLIYFLEARFGSGVFKELVESTSLGGSISDIIARALGEKWDSLYREAALQYQQGVVHKP